MKLDDKGCAALAVLHNLWGDGGEGSGKYTMRKSPNSSGSEASRDLLKAIEDRCQLHSTLATSQLPVSVWHVFFEEPTVADAIIDRLIHDLQD